ncbi:MAG: GMC family oxidoreductase [Acidimicrobiales bacterium]
MEAFDVVVVGSGFGGAVTSYRLADAGKAVLVLERGAAYPPNAFPRTPRAFVGNFWDPRRQRFGLFDVQSFSHIDTIVSAGLGGGSLIYANVLIRKDENWFETEVDGHPRPWPVTRADLEPHYEAVEKTLGAQVFPLEVAPYSSVHKTAAFRDAARALGYEATTWDRIDPKRKQWYLPKLAVTFANQGRDPVPGETIEEPVRNLHDRDRQTCRLCGECDIGCNFGSKNSLDFNYLTLAARAGAEIRTLAEVSGLAPAPDDHGYVVHYVQHPDGGQTNVMARHLVLAAGTLGSSRLLLQSRPVLGHLSPMLGRGFSGNGDLLTAALSAQSTDSGERGRHPRPLDASHGPVITSTLRSPDQRDGADEGMRGFYLQDAGYPATLSWLLQVASLPNTLRNVAGFVWHRLWDRVARRPTSLVSDLEDLLATSALAEGSLPLLGMGLDVPDGVIGLNDGGGLTVEWSKKPSDAYYREVVRTSKGVAENLHGRFLEDPLTTMLRRFVTVHPLGGCAMGRTPAEGVVDEWGRVHGHPRLHVADGSVMPGPVGPNPSLTIAALADRFADKMIDDMKDR